MHSARRVFWAVLFLVPLLWGTAVSADEVDDYVPDVTDRVARISFLRGEVNVRRADGQDWERAVLNLPLVEGDEITTGAGGRVEIQFNIHTFFRISENSFVKISGLSDEGIALSLPQGSVTLRATEFDTDRSYIEIDAPKTTISVQKAGMYRVDAGRATDQEIRVTVSEWGEARVYTENSGFAVKNGRSAKIVIDGPLAGEWDTDDASRVADEFDTWSLERDWVIAKRLSNAYYDKYYDRDIYGAEELNDYGEWVYTRKHGYAWRPFRTALSQYSNWSPYRYGQWRWIPPYGWTWVGDEPWGWATYHHGRWVWDNGNWYWTPYGYYRPRRSWWHPALVVVNIINNNVCWYPLGYHHRYYSYNRHYYRNNPRRNHRRNNNGGYAGNPGNPPGAGNPTPTSTPPTGRPIFGSSRARDGQAPFMNVPTSGVVSVAVSEFGRGRGAFQTAPSETARRLLAKAPDEVESPPILPTYRELNGKVSPEIRAESVPVIARMQVPVKTGAAERRAEGPLGRELQKSRIFGDRTPVRSIPQPTEVSGENAGGATPRRTGAVERPSKPRVEKAPEVNETPVFTPPVRRSEEPVKRREEPRESPIIQPRPASPSKRSEPEKPGRQERPSRSEEPKRSDPPPQRNDSPKSEPRQEKSEPKQERSDPKPEKPEPKPERIVERKGKDGSQ